MPESLTIDITGRCNINCEYCYNPDRHGEISAERVLEYVIEYSPELVSIGGGEPFLHNGLAQIVEEIAKKRRVCVSTNATIWNDEFSSLPEWLRKNVLLQVSIPSGIREVYAEITGRDMLETFVRNMEAYRRRYRTFINCPVYERNLPSVESVIEIGKHCNAPVRLSPVIPSGNGKNVKLLDAKGIERLKYLAVKGLKEGTAFSPLIEFGSLCPLFNKYYGINGNEYCHCTEGRKVYIDQHERKRDCEFMEAE